MFSCYSAAYGGSSRIDLGLGNYAMLPLVGTSNYKGRHISDHSPLWVELLDPIQAKLDFFFRQNLGSAGLGTIWDSAKAYMRGRFIKLLSN